MTTPFQARRQTRCPAHKKRFTVVRVNSDKFDTHAHRSFERAMEMAMPDRGSLVEVFVVCDNDAGSARLQKLHKTDMVRQFRTKGGR